MSKPIVTDAESVIHHPQHNCLTARVTIDGRKISLVLDEKKIPRTFRPQPKFSPEMIEKILNALHFYGESAVYSPTRSGDTPPIWCDTDGKMLPYEEFEAPGAMAREILAEIDPDTRTIFGILSEKEAA